QNFFTATPVVAQIDGDASGTQAVFGPEGNFRKRGVQEVWPAAPAPAAALIPSVETDADVAANPADPAHFLTYRPAHPPVPPFGRKAGRGPAQRLTRRVAPNTSSSPAPPSISHRYGSCRRRHRPGHHVQPRGVRSRRPPRRRPGRGGERPRPQC